MFDFTMPDLSWRECRIPKSDLVLKDGRHIRRYRRLCIPNDGLMAVQRDICRYLESVPGLRPSGIAHAFIKRRGVKTAVLKHDRNSRAFIGVDLKDFFESVPVEPVREALLEAGIEPYLVDKIITACTYQGFFPQGSPCSPLLTNIAMRTVDRRLSALVKANGLVVTRYADDMVFSLDPASPRKPQSSYRFLYAKVEEIVSSQLGLHLNRRKSHTAWINSKRAPRLVLGVTVRNDGLGYNAPRAKRREVRARMHNLYRKVCAAKGIMTADDYGEWRKVEGYVNYADCVRSWSLEGTPEQAQLREDPGSEAANSAVAMAASRDPKFKESEYQYLSNMAELYKATRRSR